jgi:hypothetical protein
MLGGLHAQRPISLSRYHYAVTLEFGSAFPNYIPNDQLRWQAGVYAAGGITLEGMQRLNAHWQLLTGLGLTTYLLNNKGPEDDYSLDFISPHLRLGAGYVSKMKRKGQQYLGQLTTGAQLGYTKTSFEAFENYQVAISGSRQFYYFARAEWGIRWPWQKRLQRGLPKPYSECGLFYRYNFNDLGMARITGNDYSLTMQPSGNIFGAYFRLVLPANRKKVSLPEPLPPAPIIYHPRMKNG